MKRTFYYVQTTNNHEQFGIKTDYCRLEKYLIKNGWKRTDELKLGKCSLTRKQLNEILAKGIDYYLPYEGIIISWAKIVRVDIKPLKELWTSKNNPFVK